MLHDFFCSFAVLIGSRDLLRDAHLNAINKINYIEYIEYIRLLQQNTTRKQLDNSTIRAGRLNRRGYRGAVVLTMKL